MEGCSRLCLPDVLANELVVDIVRTFNDFGSGEAGRLQAGKPSRTTRSFGEWEVYVLDVGVVWGAS